MEKMSLKLVFLFWLTVVVFCDAREMSKEEVNCFGCKCTDGKKNCNCLRPVASVMDYYETNASCHRDDKCITYCPKGCKMNHPWKNTIRLRSSLKASNQTAACDRSYSRR